jgi:hypothetical protein
VMPAPDEHPADFDGGVFRPVLPERGVNLGREKHAEALIPTAGKRLMREILARQQANVNRIVGPGTSVGHRMIPVPIVADCSKSL